MAAIWLIAVGALLFSMRSFNDGAGEAISTANGSIYMAVMALAIILNIAIIFPGLMLLQPRRLLRVLKAERQAITPRQRFRG
jgi:hypothetical protein